MGEDVIRARDFIFLLLLGLIEQCDVLLDAIEVQAADGFAFVVVHKLGWQNFRSFTIQKGVEKTVIDGCMYYSFSSESSILKSSTAQFSYLA